MSITIGQEQTEEKRDLQAKFDRWAQNYGTRAPSFAVDQTANDYVRETCVKFKRGFLQPDHQYYKIQYRSLSPDVLERFVPQLLDACAKEAYNPATVPPGQFREIRKIDPKTGQQVNEFVGREHFTKQMGRAGRRAIIRTPDTHPLWFAEANRRANTNRAESAITVIY
jgi:hypothetical protein